MNFPVIVSFLNDQWDKTFLRVTLGYGPVIEVRCLQGIQQSRCLPSLTWKRKQIQFPKCWTLDVGHWTLDKVQKSSNSECCTPSSESFRFYISSMSLRLHQLAWYIYIHIYIYIYIKSHGDRLMYLSNIIGITLTVWEPILLKLLTTEINVLRQWDGFRCQNVYVPSFMQIFKGV
jgi:hypothetical protein